MEKIVCSKAYLGSGQISMICACRWLAAVSGIKPGNAVAQDVKLSELLINKRARIEPKQLVDASLNLKAVLKAAGWSALTK